MATDKRTPTQRISAEVLSVRTERGQSLRQAASASHISASTLSRIENGAAPDLDTLVKLCKWTGYSANYLLGLGVENVNERGMLYLAKVNK